MFADVSSRALFRALLICALNLALYCGSLTAAPPNGKDLEAADAVLAKASSMDDFLSKPELVDEYYGALKKFYGDDFARTAFDAIIADVKKVKDKVPGFKDSAWKPRTGEGTFGTIKLQPAADISGREASGMWKYSLRDDIVKPLEEQAAPLGPEAERAAKVAEILRKTKERIAEHKLDVETMPGGKKAKEIAGGKFYKELKENPELRAATAYLAAKRLASPQVAPKLDTTDADVILQTFEGLRTGGKGNWSDLGVGEVPQELHTFIVDRIPKRDELLESKTIFPEATYSTHFGGKAMVGSVSKETIEAIPMHPLHTLFKGITCKECIGGNEKSLDRLMAERWATGAIPGAQVFAVMQGGRYHGFMMTIPMVGPDGKKYMTVDRGATLIRNKAFVTGPDGELRKTSLYEMWVDALVANRPKGLRGFVTSDSNYCDNCLVKETQFSSPYYLEGVDLGSPNGFKHVDEAFMRDLLKASPPTKDNKKYTSGRGVFDTVNNDAKRVVLLVPDHMVQAREDLEGVDKARKLAEIRESVTRANSGMRLGTDRLYHLLYFAKDADPELSEAARLAIHEVNERYNRNVAIAAHTTMTLLAKELADRPIDPAKLKQAPVAPPIVKEPVVPPVVQQPPPVPQPQPPVVQPPVNNPVPPVANARPNCKQRFMEFVKNNKLLAAGIGAATLAGAGLAWEGISGFPHFRESEADKTPKVNADLRGKTFEASSALNRAERDLTSAMSAYGSLPTESAKLRDKIGATASAIAALNSSYDANNGWGKSATARVERLVKEQESLVAETRKLIEKMANRRQ